ncbi:MAG: MarR family transcriptional regulator [Prolixibacteraceae bacterium]|jgi:DNA-binding MarR family transcriptional regulator|nr:MarR family transcriptional regulator [Prolixibacteraceae bacterium]
MEELKLENQLCFPFYSISRLIIRKYKPFLDELDITYPQYLVLLVLWENDHQPVNDIAKNLHLQTNTVTPLLQRLEKMKIVNRNKSQKDERKVIVSLTPSGNEMKEKAKNIPKKLMDGVNINLQDLIELKNQLNIMIEALK